MFERGALLNKLLFTKVLFRNYSVAVAPKKVFVYILFALLLFRWRCLLTTKRFWLNQEWQYFRFLSF